MPTYEYQCTACGHQLEEFQKISDAPLTDCPQCHKPTLSKMVSAAGFQLKGSGWYVTDYSKKGKTPKEGGSSTSDSGTTSTKTTETKSTGSDNSGAST